jgi:hypothetical protein
MPPKKTTNASLKCKLSPRIGSVNQWVALLLAEKMSVEGQVIHWELVAQTVRKN